jgi:hypothetical protein
MTFNIGNDLVNITVEGCPGLPGAGGYQQIAEDKYTVVLKALSLDGKGGRVKDAVMHLEECEDVSMLLDDLIELSKAACIN